MRNLNYGGIRKLNPLFDASGVKDALGRAALDIDDSLPQAHPILPRFRKFCAARPSVSFALVVHPVRNWTLGRSGICVWQGGGRRRADARQGRQRSQAQIQPGIKSDSLPDVPLELVFLGVAS